MKVNARTHALWYDCAFSATGLVAVLLLAACVSAPEPTIAMNAAAQAIAAADRTRIIDSTSPELSEARDKMIAARAGENAPVGDNASSTGRPQNRRLEVVIENAAAVSTT